MAKPKDPGQAYVTKQTLWAVAVVCLLAGFLSGVALTIYKTRSRPSMTPGPPATRDMASGTENSEVIQMLEKETTRNPDNAEAWIALGNNYFDTDRHEKAAAAYEKALELVPDNSNVWTDLGIMYRRSGRPAKAIAAFDRAIKADPRHETARFNKGIVLLHDLNDHKGAVQAWEDLLRINPAAKTPGGQPLGKMIERFKRESKPSG